MSSLGVGVVGCGLIAQIMHLPHLRELSEQFAVRALCDLASDVLTRVADDYQIEARYQDYRELITDPEVEAVLVLSSGDHAPIALAALEAGKHVFVEKPLCFSLSDADRLIESSARHKATLMVGYMKWFDPAYKEAKRLLRANRGPQLMLITTILTPEEFYFRHHRLHRASHSVETLKGRQSERSRTLAAELPGIPPALRDLYVDMLLDNTVHDLYVMRGLLGDPTELMQASFWAGGKAINMKWEYPNDLLADYNFLLLGSPGGRYQETFAYYSPEQRLILDFPSPYLQNAPTGLVLEEMVNGVILRVERQTGFEEAFKQELLHFHACVCSGDTPRSSGIEGRKDIALLQSVLAASTRALR
ncbi:MAG: Gfo/Idh/MocA family oxidoreductase [Acidobacteria bacterium]|nr:Gfo/Idh/MocA family oxidoreductase [Acidobacteriota bacterium]